MTGPPWVDALETGAPDVVAAWRAFDAGQAIRLRREVRRRSGAGSADRIVAQLGATAEALAAVVAGLPDEAFGLPGGEEDWTAAEVIGHDVASRQGLVLAASLAASGRWPSDAPAVVPGVPGATTASRDDLLKMIASSRRVVARLARPVGGHELDDCRLEHPLVGRLRCGEWLLFAGVHDLMHLEQLHRLAGRGAAAGVQDRAPDHGPGVGVG